MLRTAEGGQMGEIWPNMRNKDFLGFKFIKK